MLTNLVLHNDYLYCAGREYHSPPIASRNPIERLGCIKASHPPAVPPHQILLPPPSWALALNPCNSQLFTFIYDRSPLHATELHDSVAGPCACSPRHFRPRPGPPQPTIPTDCPPRRLLVHWHLRRNGAHRGGLRLGRLGNVDTGRCLVCVVASLVDWLRPAWILDFLIFSSAALPSMPNGDHIAFNKYKSDWLSANVRSGQRTNRGQGSDTPGCQLDHVSVIIYHNGAAICRRIAWGLKQEQCGHPLPFLSWESLIMIINVPGHAIHATSMEG